MNMRILLAALALLAATPAIQAMELKWTIYPNNVTAAEGGNYADWNYGLFLAGSATSYNSLPREKWGYDQNGCFKLDFGDTVLPDNTPFFFGIMIYDKTYKGSASTKLNSFTKEVDGETYYYGGITLGQIREAINSKGSFKTDLSNSAGYIMLTPEPTSGLLLLLGTGLLALRRKAVRV
ncbi:MAG TPA: hypothetical protein DDY72_02845 [Verrucomicrobia bacterium]|nr:hypothetical protein [Verrucomicrobiota bacterium]